MRFAVRRLVLGLAVMPCLLLPSHLTSHAAAGSSHVCSGRSYLSVVRDYYRAVVRHDAKKAESCLMPYYLKQARRFLPDWSNIKSLHALRLKSHMVGANMLPSEIPEAYAYPYAAVQVLATFVARFYRVAGTGNGIVIRFIYAVRQTRHSPWRIASIGSGP